MNGEGASVANVGELYQYLGQGKELVGKFESLFGFDDQACGIALDCFVPGLEFGIYLVKIGPGEYSGPGSRPRS